MIHCSINPLQNSRQFSFQMEFFGECELRASRSRMSVAVGLQFDDKVSGFINKDQRLAGCSSRACVSRVIEQREGL